MEARLERVPEGDDAVKFTEEEAESILERLESGTPTGVLAASYGCSPADIWRLWNETRER